MSAKQANPKKPTVEQQKKRTYVQVETGIYRYLDAEGNLTYHERPTVNDKRTKKALGFNFTPQRSLRLARDEYHRRRAEIAAGRDPYANPASKPAVAPKAESNVVLTIPDVLQNYVNAGYPDKYLRKRRGRTLEVEERNCENLLTYWGDPSRKHLAWDELSPKSWRQYHYWRVRRVPGYKDPNEIQPATNGLISKNHQPSASSLLEGDGRTGDRTVDQERNTLNNAYKFALNEDLVDANPARNLPRFQPVSEIKHCREFCPQDANELNSIAEMFFESRQSETLGWQLMFEAMTGLRTSEIIVMRMDATPGKIGYVREDGNIDMGRVKKGVNPHVFIHEGLKEVMSAHAAWHATRYPNSPWFFPGREEPDLKHVHKQALAHSLNRLRKRIGRKITSHGMRAFYVLIRRSQGVSDAIIAWELGHTSGGSVIESTYGSAPSSWQNGGGPKLKWLPEKKRAWELIKATEK